MSDHPRLMHTAIDATDARELAEFYRQLLELKATGRATSPRSTGATTTRTGWSWSTTRAGG